MKQISILIMVRPFAFHSRGTILSCQSSCLVKAVCDLYHYLDIASKIFFCDLLLFWREMREEVLNCDGILLHSQRVGRNTMISRRRTFPLEPVPAIPKANIVQKM